MSSVLMENECGHMHRAQSTEHRAQPCMKLREETVSSTRIQSTHRTNFTVLSCTGCKRYSTKNGNNAFFVE